MKVEECTPQGPPTAGREFLSLALLSPPAVGPNFQKGNIMHRECAVCGKGFEHEPARGRVPMTCSPDCARIRKTRQSEQSRQRAAKRGCPPDKHGTSTGYSYYQCTCTLCSKASRLYRQARRRAVRQEQRQEQHT